MNEKAKLRSQAPIDNQAFNNTPIIQFMKDIPRWTISTKNKIPVDAPSLKEKRIKIWEPAHPGDTSGLTTLTELNKIKNIENTNRTFRFDNNKHAKHPIICIDVENTADETIVQEFLALPMHYREYSISGGFHLLLQVPSYCITDEQRYLFDLTILKAEDKTFEIIFNRHFCTFTKKVLSTPTTNLKDPESSDCTSIRNFLAMLIEMDAKNVEKRELKKQAKLEYQNVSNSTLDDSQANLLLALIPTPAIKRVQNLSASDFENDNSQYEYNVAFQLAGALMYGIERKEEMENYLGKTAEAITVMDMVKVIADYMEQIIPYREKHEEKRDGLNWLIYLTNEAATYVKSTYKSSLK